MLSSVTSPGLISDWAELGSNLDPTKLPVRTDNPVGLTTSDEERLSVNAQVGPISSACLKLSSTTQQPH